MAAEADADQPPYLPDELITKILVRLPVKSLIRFKSVCKLWFSLISDSHFANSHFQLTSSTHTRRILFITGIPEFRSIALDSLFTSDSAPALLNPNFDLPKSHFDLKVIGSCRGFILLECFSNIYVWNPSTGVHRQIPSPPPNYSRLNFYGFGYDESRDDYLVVLVSYDCIPYSHDVLSRIWIFSMRANVCNEIVSPAHLPFYSELSPFAYSVVESVFNGAIHWLAIRHDVCEYVIVSFHLIERILLEIPLPDDHDDDIEYGSTDCSLWVFRGFLSLWVMRDEDKVDIWVMKEYKVQSSWSKTLVFDLHTISYISLVCCTKSGDIVGTDGCTGLVRYDNEGEFLEHNDYCKDSENGFGLVVYTESLLSLPSDIEQA
ncbi:putative F-box domain-containing protein [Medicago truncatula]|uniref:Galactose oxidase n=1 Tax=Medicago truncatula TaxID=3880 RepID=A0A072VJR2_MEDTR|nr:F-box/kelch-repeat protein At3g23880 [Medicago truncatula]KEH41831.1 galactose oxidase [Medicago truncatula]RHN79374.1 putative F-box domain-containing protein [Medicago truncatula]